MLKKGFQNGKWHERWLTDYKVINLLLFQAEHDVNYGRLKKLIFSLDNELLIRAFSLGDLGVDERSGGMENDHVK